MPRGKHPRKIRETPEMTTLPAGNAFSHPLTDPPPARACARCAAFEPDDPGYGWCRLNPQAVRQSVTGWCMQWKAKP